MHLLSVTQKQQNRTIFFSLSPNSKQRHPIMFAFTNDSHALSVVGAVQLIDVICVAPLRQQKSCTFNIWAHMCDKVHKQFKVKRSREDRGWRLLDCMHTYIYILMQCDGLSEEAASRMNSCQCRGTSDQCDAQMFTHAAACSYMEGMFRLDGQGRHLAF